MIHENIIVVFNKDNQTLIFLDIQDVSAFKLWLRAVIPFVATTEEVLQFNRLFKMIRSRRKVEGRAVLATWMNMAFSFKGLEEVGEKEAAKFQDRGIKAG